jgi:hypothetical protein
MFVVILIALILLIATLTVIGWEVDDGRRD